MAQAITTRIGKVSRHAQYKVSEPTDDGASFPFVLLHHPTDLQVLIFFGFKSFERVLGTNHQQVSNKVKDGDKTEERAAAITYVCE